MYTYAPTLTQPVRFLEFLLRGFSHAFFYMHIDLGSAPEFSDRGPSIPNYRYPMLLAIPMQHLRAFGRVLFSRSSILACRLAAFLYFS